MKEQEHLSIEQLWDYILSRDAKLISATFNRLTKVEQTYVLDHLQKMTEEEGCLPAQKTSAQAALQTIEKVRKGFKKE